MPEPIWGILLPPEKVGRTKYTWRWRGSVSLAVDTEETALVYRRRKDAKAALALIQRLHGVHCDAVVVPFQWDAVKAAKEANRAK